MSFWKSSLRLHKLKRDLPQLLKFRRFNTEAVEETIRVPWGYIAGKKWGNQPVQPILALHGLFDNAASFDKLLPLLDINQPVLAIDIPGFGKSSNPPPGLSPNFNEVIMWLRYLIKNVFKWDKVTLLGHSFGSNLAFNYAGLFPDDVDKYISIDCSKVNMSSLPQFLVDDFKIAYGGSMSKRVNVPLEGSYETFLNYMMESRKKASLSLNKEFCEILLTRDLKKIGENYYRSNVDRRIHLKYIARPSLPFLEALSKNIKCDVLMIKATDGVINTKRLEVYEQHIVNMKKKSPKVLSKTVGGGHHVHMENPGEVANLINEFLS